VAPFNALQLLVAVAAAVLIARGFKRLALDAAIDAEAFCASVEAALSASQLALCARICRACLPALAAALALEACTAMESGQGGEHVRARVDERRFELERGLGDQLDAIRTLGRMASPLAFIGVILELGRALSGGHGILALQRGAAESLGLTRALFTFSIGLGTTAVCLSALVLLRRRVRGLRGDLARTARMVERALGGGSEM
jgi:hypothetical protein